MYPKTDYISLISIETTHNIDGIRIGIAFYCILYG